MLRIHRGNVQKQQGCHYQLKIDRECLRSAVESPHSKLPVPVRNFKQNAEHMQDSEPPRNADHPPPQNHRGEQEHHHQPDSKKGLCHYSINHEQSKAITLHTLCGSF